MSAHELSRAVEFVPNRIYYVALKAVPRQTKDIHFFSIDRELVYWNFYLDFGPLNLGQMYRFFEMLHNRLEDVNLKNKKIYFYSSTHGNYRANAVTLLACWGIICKGMTAEQAFAPFENEPSFPPFHDATPCACTYKLTILDCLRGLTKAMASKYIDFTSFNLEEYEHFEKVENGDLSWLSPKFIAFAGPHDKRSSSPEGYHTCCPEDYIPYFKKNNVTLVVRLNKKMYDAKKFLNAGIDHLDLFYPDGTNAPEGILAQFIEACEKTSGVVAVHCKAGLGRTGTCIGAYMMKHDKLTAKECIGWLRLCRPGSIIGPQQQYMEAIQPKMWKAGEFAHADAQVAKVSRGGLSSLSISSPMVVAGGSPSKEEEKTQGDNLNSAKRRHQTVSVRH